MWRKNNGQISRMICALAGLPLTFVALYILLSGLGIPTAARLLLYGVVPLAIGLLFLAAAFTSRDMRLTFLSLVLPAGFGILAAETYLAFNPEHVRYSFRGEMPQILADDRAKESLPFTCGSSFVPDGLALSDGQRVIPLGGISGAFLGREEGDANRPRFSDAFGFNNPFKEWPQGNVELVTIGDSFTFGADVFPGHNFVDLLRKQVPDLVNLGCGGNGPLLELAALSEYGPKLKPRRVLWVYYEENDLPKDIVDERASSILKAYLDGKSQNLIERRNEMESALRFFLEEEMRKKDINSNSRARFPKLSDLILLRSLRSSLGLINGFSPESLELLGKTLRQAKTVVGGWGGELVFVYLPGPTRYTNPLARWDADGFKSLVFKEVASVGLARIDVDHDFRRVENPLGLFRGHYNEDGYLRVARTISEALKLESTTK